LHDDTQEEQINNSSTSLKITSDNPSQFDQKNLYIRGFWFLFCLVLIACIYFAKSILLPMVVSTFIALLCSPLVNSLVKIGVPRTISVLGVIVLIVGILFAGASLLTEPAQQWWSKLPELVKDLSQEVSNATNNANIDSTSGEAIVSDTNVGEFRSNTVVSLVKNIAVATPTVIIQ